MVVHLPVVLLGFREAVLKSRQLAELERLGVLSQSKGRGLESVEAGRWRPHTRQNEQYGVGPVSLPCPTSSLGWLQQQTRRHARMDWTQTHKGAAGLGATLDPAALVPPHGKCAMAPPQAATCAGTCVLAQPPATPARCACQLGQLSCSAP